MNPLTHKDYQLAEIAFRAYHEKSWASWDGLSNSGKEQWARAAQAVQEAMEEMKAEDAE